VSMKDLEFKAVVFVEDGDILRGHYFYNITLPEALRRMGEKGIKTLKWIFRYILGKSVSSWYLQWVMKMIEKEFDNGGRCIIVGYDYKQDNDRICSSGIRY
jgi:hypothetical protein